MAKQIDIAVAGKNATTFDIQDNESAWISRLFGVACGFGEGNQCSSRTRGLAVLDTSIGRFEGESLRLIDSRFEEDNALLVFSASGSVLRLESKWSFCDKTGVLSRKDVLFNDGDESVRIRRCLARFGLSPGRYDFYSQSSMWCNENAGQWQDVRHGGYAIGGEGGRSTQGNTPYMAIRDKDGGGGLIFHVVPCGNWTMKINACTTGGNYVSPLRMAVVEAGLADDGLDFELAGAGSFELPEILVQQLPAGGLETAGPELHEYVLEKYLRPGRMKAEPRVIYNTWYLEYERLDVGALRKQLAAVKEIGCEVFVVDAGWYGQSDGPWHVQVGDWREKLDGAFEGRMAEFADEVRGAGLEFGLWIEPERFYPDVPIVKANPDWFLINGTGKCYYPDLSQAVVYEYVLSEMSRLVEDYKLAWMKIDFNYELGFDPSGTEFANYYRQWYGLMDELRAKYEDVFFEGCAGGGLRLDINSLSHCDGHFLSDNANPADLLRIYQQAILRLPPGRITKWIGLRSVGQKIPMNGLPVDESPVSIVAPAGCGGHWAQAKTVNVDFATRVAMTGIPGFTGDFASLPADAIKRLGEHVSFYKKWRKFIVGSVGHLLTPCRERNDHTGWVGIQLRHPEREESLLFVYRLDGSHYEAWFKLHGLDEGREYTVRDEDKCSEAKMMMGRVLMNEGVNVSLMEPFSSAVFVVNA